MMVCMWGKAKCIPLFLLCSMLLKTFEHAAEHAHVVCCVLLCQVFAFCLDVVFEPPYDEPLFTNSARAD